MSASRLRKLPGGTRKQTHARLTEAAKGVDVVVTMLPVGGNVRDVFLGDGVVAAADPGTLFIDSSTIDVESAVTVHEAAAEAGFEMVDAPVSGGTIGAEEATLTFMCGGEKSAFDKARPILEGMGKNIVHCGGPGKGQVVKICNNMMLGIQMISVCEAFALADRLGLERQKLFDISSAASGQCWSLTTYCPVPGPVASSPANRDYQPGFSAAMMLKDLKLSQMAASQAGAATPLGAAATALYTLFVNAGNGDLDYAAIIKLVRNST